MTKDVVEAQAAGPACAKVLWQEGASVQARRDGMCADREVGGK